MTQVILRRVDTGATLTADLFDDDSTSGGYGGWASLDRPRDTSAATWTGTPALTYTLPLIFDGIEASPGVDVSVEQACRALEAWGRGDKIAPPPVLQVFGEVLVSPTSQWVLQDLAWGVRERNAAGERIQQAVTLTLLEFDAPVVLKSPAKKSRKGKGGKGGKGDDGKGDNGGKGGNDDDGGKGGKKWPASHGSNGGKG